MGIVCLWSDKEIFVTKIEYLHAENSGESVDRIAGNILCPGPFTSAGEN